MQLASNAAWVPSSFCMSQLMVGSPGSTRCIVGSSVLANPTRLAQPLLHEPRPVGPTTCAWMAAHEGANAVVGVAVGATTLGVAVDVGVGLSTGSMRVQSLAAQLVSPVSIVRVMRAELVQALVATARHERSLL